MLRWSLAAGWAAAPLTIWPAIGDALRHHSTPLHLTVAVGAWATWAVVLVATLVMHPVALTVVRSATPGAAVAVGVAVAAGTGGAPLAPMIVAGAWSIVVALVSFLPGTGAAFVNGPAYPNERRFLLAPPAPLLLGPLELAWAATVVLPVAGALMLAVRQWVAGAGCVVVGAVAARFLGRSLHRLSRRWLVFVPAGVVVHDPMALADPTLLQKQLVVRVGPALVGTDAVDLTLGALGLAVELRLREAVTLGLVRPGRRQEQARPATALMVTPSRPGAVLAEASRRQLPVGDTAPGGQAAAPPPRTSSPS